MYTPDCESHTCNINAVDVTKLVHDVLGKVEADELTQDRPNNATGVDNLTAIR